MPKQPLPPSSVTTLISLLKVDPRPIEFAITILRNPDEDEDENENASYRGYPHNAYSKIDAHLGIHAADLPTLARDFRDYYRPLHQLMLRHKQQQQQQEKCGEFHNSIMASTMCLLMVCPDHCTAWADRKRIIAGKIGEDDSDGILVLLKEELEFQNMLFTQHAKAPSAWAHRKWICHEYLNKLSRSKHQDAATKSGKYIDWANAEISLCSRVAERFPKNYYAWTHRLFTVNMILRERTARQPPTGISYELPVQNVYAFLEGEVTSAQRWLRTHISDHSSAHYGAEVLFRFIQFGTSQNYIRHSNVSGDDLMKWFTSLLKLVFENIRNIMEIFSSHEVVWRFRRLCALFVFQCMDPKSAIMECPLPLMTLEDLDQFITLEVIDLHCNFQNTNHKIYDSLTKEDIRLTQQHARTYIVWVIDNLRRYQCDALLEKSLCVRVENVYDRVCQQLREDEDIVHHFWRRQGIYR